MSAINYTDYADFLQQKLVIDNPSGFEPETSQIDLFSESE